MKRNRSDSEAYRLTLCRFGKERKAHRTIAIAMTRSPPVITRCVNSISRGAAICCGITCPPPHKGQFAPQPSPEKDTRTYAPHKITGMLYASTAQAKRENHFRASLVRKSIYL